MEHIFTIISLVLLLIMLLTYPCLKLIAFIIDKRLKSLKRKRAVLLYERTKSAYDLLLLVRTRYHKAKFEQDSEKMKEIQLDCINTYKKCIEYLEDPDIAEFVIYLPEEKKEDLEKILSLPRYKLI